MPRPAAATLWIVGTQGVVLESKDLGSHWQVTQLHDEDGGLPELFKVRSSDGLWILGNGVVYKRVQD